MAWTAPRTWTNNELVDATIMNAHVRDNLSYLLNPSSFFVSENTGTYTTNSPTAVNVGANYSKIITTNGGPILIGFQGIVSIGTAGAQFAYLGLSIDSGAMIPVNYTGTQSTNYAGYLSFSYLYNSLAAGSHTFALQWYVTASTTGTITKLAAVPLLFWGIEL
jgi:hypothetical protein